MIQKISFERNEIQKPNQTKNEKSDKFETLLGVTSKEKNSKSEKKTPVKVSENEKTDNENNALNGNTVPLEAGLLLSSYNFKTSEQINLPQVQTDGINFPVEQIEQQGTKQDIKLNSNSLFLMNKMLPEKTSDSDNINVSDIAASKGKIGTFENFVNVKTAVKENSENIPEKSGFDSVKTETVQEAPFLLAQKENFNNKKYNVNDKNLESVVNKDSPFVTKKGQKNPDTNADYIDKENGMSNKTKNNISKSIYYQNQNKSGIKDLYNDGNIVIKISNNAQEIKNSACNQVAEKVVVNYKKGNPNFEMDLFPENLGKVSVKIAKQNGVLTVEFHAENPKTHDMLLANSDEIKTIIQSSTKQPVQLLREPQDKPWYHDMQNQQNQQSQQEQQERRNQNRFYFNNKDDDVSTDDFLSVMQKLKQQSVLV